MKKQVFKCAALALLLGTGAGQAWGQSGTCGDVRWSLSGNTLTISGNGVMEEYTYLFYPWYDYENRIQTVRIEDGVENIAASAFYAYDNLTEVVIGDGVTRIEEQAFRSCRKLTELTLSENVTVIEERAFDGCGQLTSVTLPANLEEIESMAFQSCGLTQIVIPDQVATIGDNAFHQCFDATLLSIGAGLEEMGEDAFLDCDALASIQVNDANTSFCSVDDVLFDKAMNQLLLYPASHTRAEYAIPDRVSRIAPHAFARAGLESITLGSNVEQIGEGAFLYCHKETYQALAVHYEGTLATWCRIEFMGASSNPLASSSSSDIQGTLYINGEQVTDLVIPEGISRVQDYAFNRCALGSVTVGNGVTAIGNRAFQYCSTDSLIIGNRVSTIGERAFEYCDLRYVSMGNGVTSIGDYAFSTCYEVSEVNIEAVTPPRIEAHTFQYLGQNNDYCPVYVPAESVTAYQEAPYWGDLLITTRNDACGDNLTWAYADSTLTISGTGDMWHFTRDTLAGWSGYADKIDSLALPDGLTAIGNYAFYGLATLPAAILPASVTAIGDHAFDQCTALSEISFPDGLATIGNYAFDSCANLAYLTIPAGMVSIGDYAFGHCTGLTGIRSYATYPPAITEGTFYDVDKSIIVYVPEQSLDDYKAHPMWGEFFNMRPFQVESNAVPGVERQDGGIRVTGNEVHIINSIGETCVYDLQGRLVLRTPETRFTLPQGRYVIQVGDVAVKASVQ